MTHDNTEDSISQIAGELNSPPKPATPADLEQARDNADAVALWLPDETGAGWIAEEYPAVGFLVEFGDHWATFQFTGKWTGSIINQGLDTDRLRARGYRRLANLDRRDVPVVRLGDNK